MVRFLVPFKFVIDRHRRNRQLNRKVQKSLFFCEQLQTYEGCGRIDSSLAFIFPIVFPQRIYLNDPENVPS